MRISDWSSDVCSSDLPIPGLNRHNRGLISVIAGWIIGTRYDLATPQLCQQIAMQLKEGRNRRVGESDHLCEFFNALANNRAHLLRHLRALRAVRQRRR